MGVLRQDARRLSIEAQEGLRRRVVAAVKAGYSQADVATESFRVSPGYRECCPGWGTTCGSLDRRDQGVRTRNFRYEVVFSRINFTEPRGVHGVEEDRHSG